MIYIKSKPAFWERPNLRILEEKGESFLFFLPGKSAKILNKIGKKGG